MVASWKLRRQPYLPRLCLTRSYLSGEGQQPNWRSNKTKSRNYFCNIPCSTGWLWCWLHSRKSRRQGRFLQSGFADSTQLCSLFAASSKEAQKIANYLAAKRMQWLFNSPSVPHFGGIWEAAVKFMKHHIQRVIDEMTLTYEEMTILLSQIEACLNLRPLQALSDDHDDTAALIPGHFLVDTALSAIPESSLLETSTSSLTRWQHVQRMRDHIWSDGLGNIYQD